MDEQKIGGEMKKCGSGMHWGCCLMPILTCLLWIWGVLSLIYAFVAQEGTFWGMGAAGWMWSGLVSGVLAMGKGKKPGMCRMAGKCGCGQPGCAACAGGAGKCC